MSDVKIKYKPGNGWKMLNGAVYEKNNVRVHMLGYIRIAKVTQCVFQDELWEMMRITGGNRKRALMLIGNKELKKSLQQANSS